MVVDMKEYGIWEPFAVKAQTLKTAMESACLLLRVDDIVSGTAKRHLEHPANSMSNDDAGDEGAGPMEQ